MSAPFHNKPHSLRRRMVAAFALFALATALCFSAFSVMFMYVVEDSFFDNILTEEAGHQHRAWRASGKTAAPLRPFVSLHRSADTFPADLARERGAGVRGAEFAGEQGRHYHLRHIEFGGGASAYLVAEVSGELVVRPRMPFIMTFLGLSTLAILAITLGIGYWLARRATAPLNRLAELMSGALPGQLPQRFAHLFPDNEIGLLARQLDDAMARVAGFIEREQHFTRDASHELRTPLSVIDGAAQLLAQQAMPAQGAAQVQRLRSACAHMTQTVETLLALAREELNASTAAPVALLPLVERAVVQFAHLLDGKAVTVAVDVAPAATAHTHPAVLAILLGNLISNAFAHTRQGEVRIHMDGRSLVVADSGPGIAAELHGRLGQPGAKGDASSGSGLGLSIASRLAARCDIGLDITAAQSGGTRAALHLPYCLTTLPCAITKPTLPS
jgi:signal transduction histidine kinase